MADRGPKAKPPALRGIKGGRGDSPPPPEVQKRKAPLEPPKKLTKIQQRLWDRWIEPSWWLDDGDVLLAYIFVTLTQEYLAAPKKMVATRVGEMRKAMAELHLTSSERGRLGIEKPGTADPAEEFFDH